jgi:hypothetical protein
VSSGQKVNLNKSSILFRDVQHEHVKTELKGTFGIDMEVMHYLGLPTVVGRSKEGCFEHIRDPVWGKYKQD